MKKKNMIIEIIPWVLWGVIIYIIIIRIFHPYVVSGPSMEPTLHDGKLILGSSVSSGDHLSTGDIVVAKKNWWKRIVKRIVAVPGDTVEIEDGMLYVNGMLSEYQFEKIEEKGYLSYPLTLGEDEYFLMGDNRNNSIDSRETGAVPLSDIVCKVKQ